ncbi:MAG TPA: hypothetical protein VHF47_09595 [Acidimicrobiales bacterium]|nr:hypothetical protein [Acidimicrobiales bacterium]
MAAFHNLRRTAAAVALLAALVTPSSPSEAATTDECVGTFTMTASVPFGLSTVHNRSSGLFVLTSTTAACLVKVAGLTATGSLAGWCDWLDGSGTTSNGHKFNFTAGLGYMTFHGPELYGVVLKTAHTTNVPCATNMATIFTLTGKLTKIECGSPVTPPNCKGD